jgi:hypothetical protein
MDDGRMSPPGRSAHRCVFDLWIEVPAPTGVVWDFLADIQDFEPVPRSAVVRMRKAPPGRTGEGTRWHERVRFAPGLWMHIESVVTGAHRPRLLAMTFHSRWWSGNLRYDIADTSHGCRLRLRETLVPNRVLRPVTRWIERRLRVRLQERLRDIRGVLISARDQPTSTRRRA